MNINLIVAGVGGQGSILASHIIAEAAITGASASSAAEGASERSSAPASAGFNVRVGETFGAAMRGGAVASHVRIGDVRGPLVGKGQADMILALEPLEGLRIGVEYIKSGGVAILNSDPFPPVDVKIGAARYPAVAEIARALEELGGVVTVIDATKLALQAGTAKAMNVVMLGAAFASGLFPFGEQIMIEAIRERVPRKFLDVNLKAFGLGKEAYQAARRRN
jgi:indolepyruvate ferredoxin oxidoreductase beta subunit